MEIGRKSTNFTRQPDRIVEPTMAEPKRYSRKDVMSFAAIYGSPKSENHPKEATQMQGFHGNIEALTEHNDQFRRVLYTGHNLQLVLMAIQPGDEIGEEVHPDRDQFFRFEDGSGEVWIDGKCNRVKADDGIIVPQGAKHNVVNTGKGPLRLYTIYGPPEHLDGTVHATSAEAQNAHEHFDGATTE